MVIDKEYQSDSVAPVSAITFRLDAHSGVPTYLQLVHQVEHALRLGHLKKGDQLPRVKDAVRALSINPNTVLKAYRDLEARGIISGRPGQGTFVDVAPETIALDTLASLRRSLVTGWLTEARSAGLNEEEVVSLFTSALADFRELPDKRPALAHRTEGVA